MARRLLLLSVTASVGALMLAGTASAHIDPEPSEAQAGANTSIGFTVEHGCEGSPTVQIEMRLPDGVTDAVPEPIDGWDESIDEEGIVMFAGGSLAADVAGTFEVTMTLPPTPDTTIYFPFVQRCEVSEIRWIALPDDSGDEPDEPAPALDLIGPVVTATAPVATTTPQTATTAPDGTTPAGSGVDKEGDASTGTIFFIISMLAVFLVGGMAFVSARRKKAAADDVDTDGPTDAGIGPTDVGDR